MPLLAPRDQALDLSLDSDARLVAISVGIALAILVLATLAVYYLLPVCRTLWQTICFLRPIQNTTEQIEEFRPIMASTPATRLNFPRIQTARQAQGPSPTISTRSSVFFTATVRKHASVSHRPTALYTGRNSSNPHHTPTVPHPSLCPPGVPAHRRPPPPASGYVTPHIAGWIKVADDIVGRHPDAIPLRNRVATEDEVDLISGHVYIPWAFSETDEPQPTPTKIQRPSPALSQHPQLPGLTSSFLSRQSGIHRPGFFKAIGNTGHDGGHDPLFPTTAKERSKKRKNHAKSRFRGKENVDPQARLSAPTSSRRVRAVVVPF